MKKKELCPNCGYFNVYATVKARNGDDVSYACGTWVVDGEVREGDFCRSTIETHEELRTLKPEYADQKERHADKVRA